MSCTGQCHIQDLMDRVEGYLYEIFDHAPSPSSGVLKTGIYGINKNGVRNEEVWRIALQLELYKLAQLESSNVKDDEKRCIHECIMSSSMPYFNHVHDQAADESCDQ